MAKCTIAIPLLNREGMVRRVLESALMQDVNDLEILVVDDRSSDRAYEIARSYTDPRIKFVRNEIRQGLFGNFNRCLELSSGEYVRILCNDDVLMPDTIKREIDIMEKNPGVSLVFSKGIKINNLGKKIGFIGQHFWPGIYNGRDAINSVLWFYAHYGLNPLPLPSGVLLRKSAVLKAGFFNTEMKIKGDLDYWIRILKHGDMAVIKGIGCTARFGDGTVSTSLFGDITVVRELFDIIKKYSNILRENGTRKRIRLQLAGFSYAMAFKLWLRGMKKESRMYCDFAWKISIHRVYSFFSVIRIIYSRALMQITGKRVIYTRPSVYF